MTTRLTRAQVLRYRVRVQQLDRGIDPHRTVTDASILDLGVQNTGPDGALLALAVRGVPTQSGAWPQELAMAWTLRGAPHVYRRADLPDIEVALRPYSDADARDRLLMVPDKSRHKALWPTQTLGRPGAIFVNGEVAGTRRPRAKGRALGLELDRWTRWSKATRQAIAEQHELLAQFRDVSAGPVAEL